MKICRLQPRYWPISVLTFFTLLFFLPTIVFAESSSLIMGQVEAVCKHMLDLFNEDLKSLGELKYDQHEEFSIKWISVKEEDCLFIKK